jgi:hypothetical protein
MIMDFPTGTTQANSGQVKSKPKKAPLSKPKWAAFSKPRRKVFGKAKLALIGIVSLLIVALAVSITVAIPSQKAFSFSDPDEEVPAYEIASGEFSIEGFDGKNFDVTTKATSEKDLRLIGQQMRSDNVDLDMMYVSFLPPSGNRMQGQGSALIANSRKAVDAMYSGKFYTPEDRKLIWEKDNGMEVASLAELRKDLERIEKDAAEEMEKMEKDAAEEMEKADERMKKNLEQMENNVDKGMPPVPEMDPPLMPEMP